MAVLNRIHVIDDEETIRDSCNQILTGIGCDVKLSESGEKALALMEREYFDIVLLDLKMPGLNGMDVLKSIKEKNPETIVIVITGYATVNSAVKAMKNGAYDFIPKPFTPEELRTVIKRAMEKKDLVVENLYLQQELQNTINPDYIVGQSKAMRAINNLVQKVGPSDSTVLITGESGTGKELIARAIHANSLRRKMPFVTVDCGTLVENLFESELFGHVKGSFTGAAATKHGRLELANKGTIFFDEIGNIGTTVQAKLLRAIQEREITKVGSTQTIQIDIRIIAATNKNIEKAIQEGQFRDDLFYRLSVVPIHIPPLRDRKEDIPILTDYFLDKYNKKRKKSIQGVSDPAMKALMDYDWPGNVRELENAIERAVVLTEHPFIEPADLYYYGLSAEVDTFKKKALRDVEKEYIKKTLKLFNGHMQKTADTLGIDRKTLRLKIKKYDLNS